MSVQFRNFEYSFLNVKGKPVFVPNTKGYEVGYQLKDLVEHAVVFDDFYFHLRPGGHVGALHAHRKNTYFARVDLKNFFYSISRPRVARVLYELRIPRAGYYAKSSCVKNPYDGPAYSLPYGFVQSPILATVVLARSVLGSFLRDIHPAITVSVYLDDIAISSSTSEPLSAAFDELIKRIEAAGFTLNAQKTAAPANSMELFNCGLEFNQAAVTEARRQAFYATQPSDVASTAFHMYCRSVERGNGEISTSRGFQAQF